MNVIDIAIIVLIAISVLFGLYRGFISSVLNLAGGLISFFVSFKAGPVLAQVIQKQTTLVETLGSYADVASRLGDLDTAIRPVQDLVAQGKDVIAEVVSKTDLPAPIASLLQSNIANTVFGTGTDRTVQYYIGQTIASSLVNILCYVVSFLVIYLIVSLMLRLVQAVCHFPVLKQLDALVGGAFGLLRGALIVFVLLSVLPLVQTTLNVGMVNELVEQSRLAAWFTGGSLVTSIMNGHL